VLILSNVLCNIIAVIEIESQWNAIAVI